jgi:hypothetical protein
LPLQSAQPEAHAEAGKAHAPPAAHVVAPETCARFVHAWSHEPQWVTSSGTHAPPHESSPAAQPASTGPPELEPELEPLLLPEELPELLPELLPLLELEPPSSPTAPLELELVVPSWGPPSTGAVAVSGTMPSMRWRASLGSFASSEATPPSSAPPGANAKSAHAPASVTSATAAVPNTKPFRILMMGTVFVRKCSKGRRS